MSVSNEFKDITKKIKQQNIKLSICDGELTVKEIHMMPVHIFNALPVWKLRKQKEIIAKELKYGFDGQLFKTIMKQIEITVKNANEIKDKDVNFQYGLFINGKFEYVNLGNYFIKDIEDSKKKDEITVTGYDRMIRFMKTFKQSELQLTYPCKMLKLIQRICEVCGVELYSTDFYNADLDVVEDFFTPQELTYRDVLEKVVQATLTTAFIDDNKLRLYMVNDVTPDQLDKSYLTDLTIKEKFGPLNALVLGRGEVEDNIEEIDSESIKQNGRCEIRFDENEFIEFQRESVIKGMFEQIEGLEYYSFEGSDVGVMWLKPCSCIKLGDKEGNLYKSYYLKANITINTGISSDIEAQIPEQTNTEYKVTTKEEKKALKVERLAKKNEGLIKDMIEETTEQSKKITEVEQTVDGISQKVENIQDFTKEKTQIENLCLTDIAEGEGYIIKLIVYGNAALFKSKNITICASEHQRGYGESIYLQTESGEDLLTEDGQEFVIGEGSYYLKSLKITLDDYLRNLTEDGKEYFDTLEIKQDGTIKVVRRIGVNSQGELYVLTKEQETILDEKIVLPSKKGKTYYFIKEVSGLNYYAQYIIENDYSKTFLTKLELGTKIEQNAEAVKIAWNQISQYLQMEGKDGKATLNIYDKDNQILMSLNQNGENFYDDNNNRIGYIGIVREKDQDTLAFVMDIDWKNKTEGKSMAWGYNDKDGNFLPIFYLSGSYGEENSEYGGTLDVVGSLSVGDELKVIKQLTLEDMCMLAIGDYFSLQVTGQAIGNQLRHWATFKTEYGYEFYCNNNYVFSITDNGIFSEKNIQITEDNTIWYPVLGSSDHRFYMTAASDHLYFMLDGLGSYFIAMQQGDYSDIRLKNEIKTIEQNILNSIDNLEIKQFKLKNKNGKISFGIIAQELIESLKEHGIGYEKYDIIQKMLFSPTDKTEYFAVNYNQFLLLKQLLTDKKLQEQQMQIEQLEAEIKNLKGEK